MVAELEHQAGLLASVCSTGMVNQWSLEDFPLSVAAPLLISMNRGLSTPLVAVRYITSRESTQQLWATAN